MANVVAVLFIFQTQFMCLVAAHGEIKKYCCKCKNACKKVQKETGQMSRMNTPNEAVELTLLLQNTRASQYKVDLLNSKAY